MFPLYFRIYVLVLLLLSFCGSSFLLRKIPQIVRSYLLIFARMFLILILSKTFFSIGYLYMNELWQAVTPFLHASGGINGGSMGGGSGGSGWTSFDLGVLADDSQSTRGTQRTSENPAPEEEEGPPPVNPYPYQPDEVIGGDSVESVQRRLLSKYAFPSAEVIDQSRMEAEDLFEVKVDIIRQMAPLDPEGDWEGKGARALENPRTATGETSLEHLSQMLDDLKQTGVNSNAFRALQQKVLKKTQDIDNQSTS